MFASYMIEQLSMAVSAWVIWLKSPRVYRNVVLKCYPWFPSRDSVTHIVTGYETVEKVLPVIERYELDY